MPYPSRSVPPNIEHTVIWTRLPILHPSIVPEPIRARVEQEGLWGFTGTTSPPRSPSTLPSCLPGFSECEMNVKWLERSLKKTQSGDEMIMRAGYEVHEFVRNRWAEKEWEAAWFVNPPVRCSVLLRLAEYLYRLWLY